jgi:hypothetical protein
MTAANAEAIIGPARPTLDDVAREFPHWHCWKGVAGMLYASLRRSPPLVVRGTDPQTLRAAILQALADL